MTAAAAAEAASAVAPLTLNLLPEVRSRQPSSQRTTYLISNCLEIVDEIDLCPDESMSATMTIQPCAAELGSPIPNLPHAVSVSLPTWKANIGYEEGEEWVLGKMKNGYPRFFIHLSIQAFSSALLRKYGSSNEGAILFPSTAIASRCRNFILAQSSGDRVNQASVKILNLVLRKNASSAPSSGHAITMVSAVIYPSTLQASAKTFWQHTGDGVSSRRAEFCHRAFDEGYLVPLEDTQSELEPIPHYHKGPRRYQRGTSIDQPKAGALNNSIPIKTHESLEYQQFIEERFGRNLDITLASKAKLAIRRRIAGSLTTDAELPVALEQSEDVSPIRKVDGFSPDDIYLYPTGMSAISNTHQTMLNARGPLKSIMFGFPYIDTLKVLEKFGPGCLFYGHGSSEDLDDLEARCEKGEKFLALFCEFPGNPLLRSPDLRRIRRLADKYDFGVVVDETVGNFMNIHVLPSADAVVSSLTKVFSGDSNVMGGSCVLNPQGRYYDVLKKTLERDYEDNYWPEDAVFMERNSRDFVTRIERINRNAEALCDMLKQASNIKEVYYPKYSPTKTYYEDYRNTCGGYGGLFSITFFSTDEAVAFFDAIEIAKGPSLGTNFTLASPFVILAHYHELEWAAQYGVEADLIRVSVGLENTDTLLAIFRRALNALNRGKGSAKGPLKSIA